MNEYYYYLDKNLKEGFSDIELKENKEKIKKLNILQTQLLYLFCFFYNNIRLLKFIIEIRGKNDIKEEFSWMDSYGINIAAGIEGNLDIVKYLVEECGCDFELNDKYNHNGAIGSAESHKNIDILNYLKNRNCKSALAPTSSLLTSKNESEQQINSNELNNLNLSNDKNQNSPEDNKTAAIQVDLANLKRPNPIETIIKNRKICKGTIIRPKMQISKNEPNKRSFERRFYR